MSENEQEYGLKLMRQYCDDLKFVGNLKDVDLLPTNAKDESRQSCNIFIMRHAERVDFTFGEWIQYCFDDKKNYIQKDLNLPASLPSRKSYPESYFDDTPITNVGKFLAKSMGKNFKAKNFEIDCVYCSPAFRCIQTCDAFLKGINKKQSIKIRIEPALYEWVTWLGKFPQLMTSSELIEAGYNIDTKYTPYLSEKELRMNTESVEEHYRRGDGFVKKIINTYPTGSCLLVGHASTLDTCSRLLIKEKCLSLKELMDLVVDVPYCSLVRLTKTDDSWSYTTPPCPPMSYSTNEQFNWKAFVEKY